MSRNRAVAGRGGGIYNLSGRVDISGSNASGSSRLHHNRAVWGGAIANEAGNVTVEKTEITSNRALAGGGGLYNTEGGTAVVLGSLFDRNRAIAGGGILNEATLKFAASTLSNNHAFDGGGLLSAADAFITTSTLSENQARNNGGGIWSSNGITIFNSTLSGNTAALWGGGLYVDVGTATVSWTTFMGNDDGDDMFTALEGGSVFGDAGALVNVSSSILSASRGGNTTAPTQSNCFGSIVGSDNLTDTLCGSSPIGNVDLDPDLALNGNANVPYPTLTHRLLSATPVVGTSCPMVDQRGFGRGATCDVGSFEL
jgi:hypothetical protein